MATEYDHLDHNDGYAVANRSQYFGLTRIADFPTGAVQPDNVALRLLCIGKNVNGFKYISVGEVAEIIGYNNYVPPLTDETSWTVDALHRSFTTIFIDSFCLDHSDFENVNLNPIGIILQNILTVTGHGCMFIPLTTQLVVLPLISPMHQCIEFAKSALVMTSKNTLSISNLDETTFLSIFIGICGLLPGDVASPRELYESLKNDTHRVIVSNDVFYAKHIMNRATQLKGYRVDGNLVTPNNYLLMGTLWALLNGSMR